MSSSDKEQIRALFAQLQNEIEGDLKAQQAATTPLPLAPPPPPAVDVLPPVPIVPVQEPEKPKPKPKKEIVPPSPDMIKAAKEQKIERRAAVVKAKIDRLKQTDLTNKDRTLIYIGPSYISMMGSVKRRIYTEKDTNPINSQAA